MEAGTKTGKNVWGKALLAFLLIVLIVAVGGIATYIYQTLNIDTFYEGVEVDGLALGGMTREEALSAVQDLNQLDLDKIKIVLTHGDMKWEYGYEDVNAQIDIEEVVDEAYLVGRQGTFLERIKEIYNTSQEPVSFETTLTYDVSQLRDEVEAIATQINEEPVDATIEFHPDKEEKFTLTPEKIGKGMLVDKTMEDLIARVDAGDFSIYEIPTQELEPQYTVDEMQTWTSRIAYYSTKLTDNSYRNHNIKLSSSAYYNVRLDPGEVYSFNDATGPRGAAQGYKAAPVIKEGKRFEDEPGGGNCQSSTTIYGAALRADLEIVERAPHSIPSTYTDIGTDATVNYPYADIKFKNNKDTPIFITRYISGGRLHVEIYGKQSDEYDKIEVIGVKTSESAVPEYKIVEDPTLYEGQEIIEFKSRPEIKAVSYKIYYKDGKEIERVKVANSRYPKVVGQKRVGTKERPVDPADKEAQEEKENKQDETSTKQPKEERDEEPPAPED
ncbi:MAG: hypothetical protein GX375_06220 [Clostridiales bacterium]|nr:hypothetical protein [Clostridiales bacterium]